ncbi:putative TPR repeat-containing protein [Magnetofaba australis IT-1]|uniref:Putative TPR repeat-containing protein n=2 Tax=Magnetofaba TaxID=1472292 RepID=A0A1Y2JZD7_9PROT|nr:putative TPR repeat-containing protein [Magnetofaba australis IT-1]
MAIGAQEWAARGELARAIKMFARALKLGADLPQAQRAAIYNNQAMALKKLGRFDAALGAITHAVALAPAHPRYLYNRALLLVHLQQYEQARNALDALLQKHPNLGSPYPLMWRYEVTDKLDPEQARIWLRERLDSLTRYPWQQALMQLRLDLQHGEPLLTRALAGGDVAMRRCEVYFHMAQHAKGDQRADALRLAADHCDAQIDEGLMIQAQLRALAVQSESNAAATPEADAAPQTPATERAPEPAVTPTTVAATAPQEESGDVATPHAEPMSPVIEFFVEVGFYEQTESANEVRHQVESLDLPVQSHTADIHNTAMIHLLAGPFATRDQAEQAQAALRIGGVAIGRVLPPAAP